jgi:hypothetical protein
MSCSGRGMFTVTGKDKELIVVGQVVYHNVWVCRDDLLLWRKVGALLELKVTNGSGKRQVAVHSAEIDKAAGRCDSCLFAYGSALATSTWPGDPAKREKFDVAYSAAWVRHTLVLWFMVKGQRLRAALDAQNASRVASVGLQRLALIMWGTWGRVRGTGSDPSPMRRAPTM